MKIKKEILDYLHRLRNGGSVNMFGAAPFLADEFDLEIGEARKITMAYISGKFEEAGSGG